jgi:hypothetical protein
MLKIFFESAVPGLEAAYWDDSDNEIVRLLVSENVRMRCRLLRGSAPLADVAIPFLLKHDRAFR